MSSFDRHMGLVEVSLRRRRGNRSWQALSCARSFRAVLRSFLSFLAYLHTPSAGDSISPTSGAFAEHSGLLTCCKGFVTGDWPDSRNQFFKVG